jgi:hypothetical protein
LIIRSAPGFAFNLALPYTALLCLSVFGTFTPNDAWAASSKQHIAVSTTDAFEIWGYQPWWMQENWPSIDLGLWRRAIFFELPVHADGRIGELPASTQQLAEMASDAHRCGSHLDIAFTLFDEPIFEQIFVSEPRRRMLISEIAAIAMQSKAHGIHLDFEIYKPVTPVAISGFRNFVAELKSRLHDEAPHRKLSLFGIVGASQELVDKETLDNFDFVVIQGYDAHWRTGPATGSVAPLKGNHAQTWEKSLKYYLQLGAQRSRLLFSLPYFGYEWPTTAPQPGSRTTGHGHEISYAPVPRHWVPEIVRSAIEQSQRHGKMRDHETGSPYYAYQNAEGKWQQGWFEDEASMIEKFSFIKREKLAGLAAFPLGYDRGTLDPLLGHMFGRRPHCTPTGN